MSNLDQSPAASSIHQENLGTRPWPIYPLALACLAPAVAIAIIIAVEPSIAVWSLQRGAAESAVFIAGLFFALLLAAAGVLLYLQRKLSVWLLYACLPWCFLRAAAGPPAIYAAAFFGLGIALVLVYINRLDRRGLIR